MTDEEKAKQAADEENDGPADGIDEKEVSNEKNKLKAMGLEKLSNDGFSRLLEHQKPIEKKEDKTRRPFTF